MLYDNNHNHPIELDDVIRIIQDSEEKYLTEMKSVVADAYVSRFSAILINKLKRYAG